MSLLREGDSVNFQKASCTLDGCVKIYTSRVDSVATETGKLLSGLADSNSKKASKEEADEQDGEDGEEEEDEDGRKKKKKRVQRSSEATLAPSFGQLQLKKLDLEFSVDPLFKKATADFDEGGAKGLLLNHLTIDANGRIVFDSSDDAQEEKKDSQVGVEDEISEVERNAEGEEEESKSNDESKEPTKQVLSASIDVDALAQKFFPDVLRLDEQEICPSLKTYELGGASDTLDIPFLKDDDWKQDADQQKASSKERSDDINPALVSGEDEDDAGLYGFDVAGDVGFGEGGEAWAKDAALETQSRPFDGSVEQNYDDTEGDGSGHIGSYDADSAQYGVTLNSKENDAENILSYFDQALRKNWAGPEHWRIRKVKDANKPAAPARQRKEKEPFEIDFSAPMSQQLVDSLYTPAATNSTICLPKSQWKSKTRNLLPDDKHFNSKQLLRLFLKPKARIGARRLGSGSHGGAAASTEFPNPNGEMDGAFWVRRAEEAAQEDSQGVENNGPMQGDYDANFFQDDGLGAPPGVEDDDDEVFADARENFSPGIESAMDGSQQPPSLDAMMAPESQQGVDGGFGSQLVTQSRRIRPEYVQYARTAKKVDVRRLKEEIWRGLGYEKDAEPNQQQIEARTTPAPLQANADGSLRFTDAMNGLQQVYPQKAMEDISTSYCFICLLHLANEKGLVLEHEQNWEEIRIRRDENAEVMGEG